MTQKEVNARNAQMMLSALHDPTRQKRKGQATSITLHDGLWNLIVYLLETIAETPDNDTSA